ncbi:hypothetical protein DFP72DRAFT_958741 [Ephemerocybe angulata]|uniref:Uncharacterized protein n=1 Tax=Ephemerocybe angulata TaxID=980116 RepID=A0A8H6IA67_9AGAR|nr:hypothetical protein DFP72DRAFT_958741 [Tulosesus angulatus]
MTPNKPTPSASSVFTSIGNWMKIWMRTRTKRKDRRDGDYWIIPVSPCRVHMNNAVDLPLEIIIQIATIAASSSQEAYCNFSLVSKDMRLIIEKQCLPKLPIRLESTAKIVAFHTLLVARPELAPRIRYLWVRGARSRQRPRQGYSEPTAATWREFKASAFEQLYIINSCTKLVSLACSFPVMFLCFRFTRDIFFKHDQLKELTLFENWNLWTCFGLEPPVDGPHLFLQLTHLTILDGVAPHFPTRLFPSLQCFSAEIPRTGFEASKVDQIPQAALPEAIQSFPRDIQISLLQVDTTDRGVKGVASDDDRPWQVRVGNPRYFQWWSARIWGNAGVWAAD